MFNLFGNFYSSGQKVLQKEGELGEVWISGYEFAHNVKQLQKLGIQGVCSAVDLHFKYPENFHHKMFDLDDHPEQDATGAFEPASQFIKETRKKTNVLVHCAAGISRCSTLLIAYLMKEYKWSYEESLRKIKEAREFCQPNSGFVKQLTKYEQQLGIPKE